MKVVMDTNVVLGAMIKPEGLSALLIGTKKTLLK